MCIRFLTYEEAKKKEKTMRRRKIKTCLKHNPRIHVINSFVTDKQVAD